MKLLSLVSYVGLVQFPIQHRTMVLKARQRRRSRCANTDLAVASEHHRRQIGYHHEWEETAAIR